MRFDRFRYFWESVKRFFKSETGRDGDRLLRLGKRLDLDFVIFFLPFLIFLKRSHFDIGMKNVFDQISLFQGAKFINFKIKIIGYKLKAIIYRLVKV